MPELVSVVGGDDIGFPLDLQHIEVGIQAAFTQYEPEVFPGLTIRFEEDDPTIIVYSSGKYNIAGAATIDMLHETHRAFSEAVADITGREVQFKDRCEVRNLVYVEDFGEELDLDYLATQLGEEYTSYEPEKFPCVNYYAPGRDGVFKIFRSGKITLSGIAEPDVVGEMFAELKERIVAEERAGDWSIGDRVRVDIPDENDPDYRLHGQHGDIQSVFEDDAGQETGRDVDSVLLTVELDNGEEVDVRGRDVRPPLDT
jgi:transcription initiation factor TFIID TATA-box-binding protein